MVRIITQTILISIFLVPIISQSLQAQWKYCGTDKDFLFDITKIDSVLYIGGHDAIFRSKGTGINDWEKINFEITQVHRFQKYDSLILAIANSGLYESSNEGITWQKRNQGTLVAQSLLRLGNMWLAGITCDGVYRSLDYGKNWIYNPNYDFDSLSCVSSLLNVGDKIFAVTGKGLQVSSDTGLTWQKIDTTITGNFTYNNTLINDNGNILAGGEGGILKSSDLGNTWTSLGLHRVSNIIRIAEKLFVITSQAVYFSTDDGLTWKRVYSDGFEVGWNFSPMALETHGENLFLATRRGLYYMQLIEFEKPRLTIEFDEQINLGEIAIGELKDTSVYIQNRGYKDLIVTDVDCNSSYISVSPKTFTVKPGYVQKIEIELLSTEMGELNALLTMNTNDLEGKKEYQINAVITPIKYYVTQNYPNPFNSSTTINFQISDFHHVDVTVYNSNGEKVTTLVNKILDPGVHKVKFNASNYASGIYFYKISAGPLKETNKMLFLK